MLPGNVRSGSSRGSSTPNPVVLLLIGFLWLASQTAVCLLILRTRLSDDGLYYCLCGTSVLWGMFMGLHGAPLEALFGDSVESGTRPRCDLG